MSKNHTPGARRVVPRSRGALSGLALIALGIWGALIPFVGPYFNFSFTPDDAWHWTSARGWLEVLPGAAAFVAGFLLLVSKSRTMTLVAAWLGIAAGAWFAVGPQLEGVWHIGSPGRPAGTGAGIRALEALALFTLLGVVIVYFAATAFGRLSVVSLRDAHAAERREAEAAAEAEREREAAAARDRDAAAAREREAAEAAAAHESVAAGRHNGDDRDRNDRAGLRDDRDDLHNDDLRGGDHDRDGVAVAAAPAVVHHERTDDRVDREPVARRESGTHGAHSVSPDQGSRQATAQPQGYPQQEPQQGYDQQPGYANQQGQQGYNQQQGYDQQPGYGQQQGHDQPRAYEQQGTNPAEQGYAQPQHYDQGGYRQTPGQPDGSAAQPEPEHQSLAQRLFHRR